jgi:farnesyl-diphosphate farnesyltransferase
VCDSATLPHPCRHVCLFKFSKKNGPYPCCLSLILLVVFHSHSSSSSPLLIVVCSKKQGAYGKIKTHQESLLSQLLRVDEVWSAIYFLKIRPLPCNLRNDIDDVNVAFCDEILTNVSRSFAAVIRQLPSGILLDVAIFYLVLRALDTIEDDTTAFASHEEKIRHLLDFTNNALGDDNPDWCMDHVGQGDEKRLLQEFSKCHAVYIRLPPTSRAIITDITLRMATGMAEFVDQDLGQGTKDIIEYNRYCHFVAGLVGEGLSRLFASSQLEASSLAMEVTLSDQMGLFLQKTNIIRDFLEDYVDQRAFWPQSVWKQYGTELGDFCRQDDPTIRTQSLACLDELISDALELVPDCLQYMAQLQCVEIFRFCAIPQVMAIATLEKCYHNPNVFTGVVKIRKGLSCRLILRTNNLTELHETFYEFAAKIRTKCVKEQAAHGPRTLAACDRIMALTKSNNNTWSNNRDSVILFSVVACLILLTVMTLVTDPTVRRVVLVGGVTVAYLILGPVAIPTNLKPAAKIQ